jgi:predicted ATPase
MCGGAVLANVLEAPFAALEADRLLQRRAAVVQGRFEADLALGLGATLVDELRVFVEANPFDERTCGQLMVALYRAGQPAAALDAYRSFRLKLGEELGLVPGPALVEVERQILTHDPGLLVQAGPAARRHNLPQDISSFVGRLDELAVLDGELSRRRLVTLTGAGGTGKSRLAIRLAASTLERFDDGVWLAELAPLSSSELVATVVIEAVGGRVDDGVNGLVDTIGSRSMLLVVDNCEHVIDAAAGLVERLLRRCPNLRILATSREPLSVDGEFVYRVPPLAVQDGDGPGDAVVLFADRAAAQRTGFQLDDSNEELIVQVCARLDGLPLAIELAAAQLRTMSMRQLLQHLGERLRRLTGASRRPLARQQTLRGMIDWSYDLLGADEQFLLDRLCVFAGGLTIDAVQAVNATDGTNVDSVSLLTGLVDKSLVEIDPSDTGRYRLLETIREYAAERFARRGDAIVHATRLAHADHYLTVAEAAGEAIDLGPGQYDALQQLDVEADNIRTAIATFADHPEHIDEALRIANALWLYWQLRGFFYEGLATTQRLLDLSEQTPLPQRVRALCTAADLSGNVGDLPRSKVLADTAMAEAMVLDRPDLLAVAVQSLSIVFVHLGRADDALKLLDAVQETDVAPELLNYLRFVRGSALLRANRLPEARAVYESLQTTAQATGHDRLVGITLVNLSAINIATGDTHAAAQQLEHAHQLAARLRDVSNLAYINSNQGLIALSHRDWLTAWIRYRETLLLGVRIGERAVIAGASLGIAVALEHLGDPVTASILHGFVDTMSTGGATALDPTEIKLRLDSRQRLHTHLGADEFERLSSRGNGLTSVEAVDLATSTQPSGTKAEQSPNCF